MLLLLTYFNRFFTAEAEPVTEEASTLSSIVTILVAIIVAFIAIKILKNTAKTIFILAVVIAGILLVTGVIDFAMIKSAGYTIWDWLLNTDLYQEVTNQISSTTDIISGAI